MPRQSALSASRRRGDGFLAGFLSVLLHGVLITALVYGVYFQPAPQEEILPIEAELDRLTSVGPERTPTPPAVETPPQPSPEDLAAAKAAQEKAAEEQAQEQQRQAAEQKAAQEKAAQEAAQKAETERVAKEAQQKAEAERVAQEKADAERKAREEADRKAKEEADRKAKEAAAAQKKADEAKRQAELKKQQEAQEAQERTEREAELKRNLAQEEQDSQAAKAAAARASGQMASWVSAITARIERAWNRPPSVQPGLQCVLHVTQEVGGQVTNVTLGACNGDEAVRESIKAAVKRASPLPAPPDPALFDRNLVITFAPREPG